MVGEAVAIGIGVVPIVFYNSGRATLIPINAAKAINNVNDGVQIVLLAGLPRTGYARRKTPFRTLVVCALYIAPAHYSI